MGFRYRSANSQQKTMSVKLIGLLVTSSSKTSLLPYAFPILFQAIAKNFVIG